MINNLKHWCGFGIPFIFNRCGNYTYNIGFMIPDISINPKINLGSLKQLHSPTDCYYTDNSENITIDNHTYKIFYCDSQGCIDWYERDDGLIFFSSDGNNFFLCAENMVEFCNRITLECNIWFKINKIMYSNSNFNMSKPDTKLVKQNYNLFTKMEKEYLEFYFNLENKSKVGIIKKNNILQFKILDNSNMKNQIQWTLDRTDKENNKESKYYISDEFGEENRIIKAEEEENILYYILYLKNIIYENFENDKY